MRFNPTFVIASFVMRRIISVFKLEKTFATMFSLLFSTTSSLVLTVGVLPTIRVLFVLRRYIFRNIRTLNFSNLSIIMNRLPRLNGLVIQKVLEVIEPFLKFCIKHPNTFARLYNLYFVLVILSSFKILSLSFIKFILSIILSSLGILWSETLSSISWLKHIAEFVVDFTNNIIKSIGKLIGVDNVKGFNSDWIPILAMFILGVTGIIIIAIIGDHYNSDIIRTIPYLGDVLDSIYSIINPIIDWFTGKKPPLIDHEEVIPNRILLPQPKPISRSSSSSSSGSSTATQSSIPTPPATRTPTPSLPEDYSDVLDGNWS